MTEFSLPYLAEEQPTGEITLDLLSVNGGHISFVTNVAYILGVLEEGIPDLLTADLERMVRVTEMVWQELRDRKVNQSKEEQPE